MIHVYTGNGKGKTTAALGLALRCAGAGKRVYLCQFLKKNNCSEHRALKKIRQITCRQFGAGCFLARRPSPKDIASLQEGLDAAKKAILSGRYALVIVDEINVALALGFIELSGVVSLIKATPPTVELVLTGRNAHPKIVACADLVSRISETKHYFHKGLKARKGIEF